MAKETYGSNPPEASSNGSLNAAPPMEQRAPQGEPLGAGPKIDPATNAYAPASYELTIVHPIHGKQTLVRTDR